MAQVKMTGYSAPELAYKRAEFSLQAAAGMYAQSNNKVDADNLRATTEKFKNARLALYGNESPEQVEHVVAQNINAGRQQMENNVKLSAMHNSGTSFDVLPADSLKAVKATRNDLKLTSATGKALGTAAKATSAAKYKPKPKEGLTEVAAQQQTLVDLAKHAICHGDTDERSAELLAAISIARHNPHVKNIDIVRKDIPLEIPDFVKFQEYLSQVDPSLLKDCRVSYTKEVHDRNVGDFFPAQRSPVMASLKIASK